MLQLKVSSKRLNWTFSHPSSLRPTSCPARWGPPARWCGGRPAGAGCAWRPPGGRPRPRPRTLTWGRGSICRSCPRHTRRWSRCRRGSRGTPSPPPRSQSGGRGGSSAVCCDSECSQGSYRLVLSCLVSWSMTSGPACWCGGGRGSTVPLCSVAGVLEPRSSSSPGGGRGWETQPRRGSASTNTSYFINDLQHILSIFGFC